MRLQELEEMLKGNNFEAYTVADSKEAGKLILDTLLPACNPKIVAYGGSSTLKATGVLDAIAENDA